MFLTNVGKLIIFQIEKEEGINGGEPPPPVYQRGDWI